MSGKSCLLIFGLILSLVPPWPPGELGTVWAASCDVVLDYGADPTFTNPATIPIQNAIDDAHAGACDGEVHLPPGTYKITDAIKLKSNVTLNISSGATLKVSEDQSDLSSIFRVVHVDGVSNVVIRGGGTIDASGPFYHNSDGTRVSGNRPGFLLFVKKSDHITVENVLLKDTVEWTFTIYDSDYVSVDNIIIRNPEKGQARNTDGIDIVASRHVTVRNCDIETGDDAITLKSTPFDEDTWHNLPDMHDILVEDTVVASTCNATKIGTETSNDIYDVTFRNITVNQHGDGGRNTAGIIVQSNDGNSVHDIAFINYTINKAYCPIFIGLQDRDEYISGPIGSVYNITFKNIHSTQSNPQPIFFNADEDGSASIENVVLENITIHNFGTQAGSVPDEMDGDYPNVQGYGIADAYGLWARDTKGLIMRGCINFYDDGNSGRVMTALWDNVTDIIDERTDPDDCAPAPEANCSNGLDDDHDGQTDCLDLDCDGFDQCEYATESTCGDNIDNNGDGHTDCRDSDCSDAPNCDGAAALQTDFNSGEDGFVYADDEFNDTDNPFFASGDHRISGGYQGSGCIHVKLGNVNGTDILNGMSGGWTAAFRINNPAQCQVRLKYRQIMTNFDADECAQAMVRIDDGPVEILADLCGRGQDTGWEEKILHRSLQPGDHTITVGGYNNKKTSAGEVADIYFDDVEVTPGDTTTPETNCGNGLDDDHDGQVDCLDLDCDGVDPCEYATERTCGDNIDNDGDGHTDCRDSDCSDAPNCDGAAALQADFNSGEDGFFYADDEFNDTDNPFFASGDHRISDGYQNSGCVHVKLGNVNGTDILNGMSGGWTTAFLVNNPAECRVRLRYRQVMTNFDADECAQAMVKIDDGPVEILADLCGRGQDTGWQEKILHRSLQPGDHTITVGGYNNKKTSAGEVADIYFDDIEVTQGDITTPETNCSNGFDDDHDGESDCLDIDCDGVDQCEFGTEITCDDYFDNDGDTQVDCDDTNCRGLPECPAPPESECSDGRDDDSDGLTDCRDSDCDGIGLCEFGTEISCDDDTDNDGDGHTDCNDMDCAEAIHCVNLPLLFENFNGCDHSLIYEDDEFYGTNNPLFASGECIPSGGVSNSGELHVLLGNVNGMDILDGISGGWKGGFYLHGASEVKVSLDYRLIMTGFDADECAQVLARIDDRPSEVLEELCGQGKDTGWQSEAFMRSLSAGEHTITIGGYNNKKTGEREFADIYFDNVEIR